MKKEEEEKMSLEESQHQLVSFLLRLAGSRPAIPADATQRVHSTVRAHWKQEVRSRLYRRWVFSFGTPVAALFLIYLFSMHLITAKIPSSVPLGFVENLNGSALVSADTKNGPSGHPLGKGDILMTGTNLQTGDSGRLLFHVLGSGTLRLDINSRLHLKSESSLVLDYGAVYIDSAKSDNHVALLTTMGIVRDIGTQFEVRLNAGTIRIRVREGSVSLYRNGFSRPAPEGTELVVDPRGKTSFRNIPKYGSQWRWLSEVAPTFHMEGQTLMEFLKWVARENGWNLKFEQTPIQQTAIKTVLHGSIKGVSPEETPDVVLPVCGLSYSLVGGVFTVKPGKRT